MAREGVVETGVEETLELGGLLAMAEVVALEVGEPVVELDDSVSDLVSSVAIGNGVPEGNAVV